MTFRDAIAGGRFVLAAELTLRRESTADDVRAQVARLGPWVDALQVSDNPYAWVQMSAVAAAALVLESGVDALPLITCRDRARAALRADLAGLRALGVTSLLAARGPRVPPRHAVRAATVFDLSAKELIALAAGTGAESTGLLVGTVGSVFAPGRRWRAEALAERRRCGAGFLQTPLCFDLPLLREYLERLAASGPAAGLPVVLSLAPLPSAATARWLRRHVRDARIPGTVVRRLEGARDPRGEGIRICAETMREAAAIDGVAGICLATMGDAEALEAALCESGLRG
jgi:methylenetetrahydrofolate reductase (NADPH)